MRSLTLRGRTSGLALAVLGMATLAFAGGSEEFIGTPTRVFDGDSFVLRTQVAEVEVRLIDIDAPEHGQAYADAARSALDRLIWKERLRVVAFDEDRYHRKVCRVYRLRDGLDVNRELVRGGHVWVYRRRVRDTRLYDLELQARRAKLGLWALAERELEPPWRWRREHPRADIRDTQQTAR